VLVDLSTATGSGGCLSDQPDALRIASHQEDLGSSPSELDRGGSADAASSSREHDDGHATDLTGVRRLAGRSSAASEPRGYRVSGK
jgi:hypothetical protein